MVLLLEDDSMTVIWPRRVWGFWDCFSVSMDGPESRSLGTLFLFCSSLCPSFCSVLPYVPLFVLLFPMFLFFFCSSLCLEYNIAITSIDAQCGDAEKADSSGSEDTSI